MAMGVTAFGGRNDRGESGGRRRCRDGGGGRKHGNSNGVGGIRGHGREGRGGDGGVEDVVVAVVEDAVVVNVHSFFHS